MGDYQSLAYLDLCNRSSAVDLFAYSLLYADDLYLKLLSFARRLVSVFRLLKTCPLCRSLVNHDPFFLYPTGKVRLPVLPGDPTYDPLDTL